MPIPIKCFTCGNTLADKYEAYKEKVREEIKPFVTQYIIDNYLEDIKYYFGIFT